MARDRKRSVGLEGMGLVIAVVAALLLAAAAFGTRWGAWHFRTGFQFLQWAAYLGLFAAALSGVGVLIRLGLLRSFLAVLGIGLGLGTAWLPYSWYRTVRSLPPIHDITTDTEDPPRFSTLLPLREGATNPPEYGGPEVARQQRLAYPDIGPLVLDEPRAKVFARALEAARAMGWTVVSAEDSAGRLEATATTRWFGFQDDVVVRLTSEDGRTRVDVRSVSREGKSDVGTNARRIRAYLDELRGREQEEPSGSVPNQQN